MTAVFYKNNNPRAISGALDTRHFLDMKQGEKNIFSARDFSDPSNELKLWDVEENSHNIYAPVRFFLWEKYIRKEELKNSEFKRDLYNIVFQAIVNEIEYRLSQPGLTLSAVAKNERLINEITRLVKEYRFMNQTTF